MFSSIPKKTIDQLEFEIRRCLSEELPRNPNRRNRGGCNSPLSIWMEGTPKNCPSKILAVTSNKASYPYANYISGIRVLASRIALKYKITWVQHAFLLDHLIGRYAGRNDGGHAPHGIYEPHGLVFAEICNQYFEAQKLLLENAGHTCMPLNAILSPNVTNLILQLQLEEMIEKLQPRRKTRNGR